MNRSPSDVGPNEHAVIAAFLAGLADVFYRLERSDFTSWFGATVFDVVDGLLKAGKEVDLLTIEQGLALQGASPGIVALTETMHTGGSPSLRFTAVNHMKRARAMREAESFKAAEYDPEELPMKFIEQAKKIRDLLNYDGDSICDIAGELKQKVPKVPTGFAKLDELLEGGIEKGAVFTIGGVPGDGKTAMATHMAARALDAGRTVHFVTLEMKRPALIRRIMKAYWGKTQDEIDRDIDAALEMAGKLTITDTLSRLPDVLGSLSRHADADLIFVDYAQRIRDDNYRNNRTSETESVYGALANFAREFEVPLVVLSQLNRDYKSDKDDQPQMYHMKGSGAIEADSHIIGLLHNPNMKEEQSRGLIADNGGRDEERILFVRKNRNGRIGSIRFVFDKPRSMFRQDSFYFD